MIRRRFKYFMPERNEFSSTGDETLLSVSEYYGVKPRTEAFDADAAESRADSLEGYRKVYAGDFVMNYMLAWKGAYGVSDYDGIVSPAYAVYRIDSCYADPRFIHHRLRSQHMRSLFRARSKGIIESRLRLYPDAFLSMGLELPDLDTQKAIADFLDRETARIDHLIETKQRLVELLKEREKNLIGECLARGIDKGAPRKQTPLVWLGDIPEHWDVFPLKSLIWYQEGPGILAEDFRDEGIPLLRIKGLSGRHATLQGCNYLDPRKVRKRWNHFRVEIGDFLISASATRGGIASRVTEEAEGAVPYTGIIRVKPRPQGYVADIIPYFLLSSLFDAQIDLLSVGSTIQHFGPTHLGRMKAPLPPQKEQMKIARFLDGHVPVIQKAREKTEQSQAQLRQFRSALTTAAVTGQIDVTTWGKQGQTDRRLDRIEEAMHA